LDVGGNAHAVVFTLLPTGFLAGAQFVIAGKLQGALQALLVVGGIVGKAGGGGKREFPGLGEVPAAELGRVHVEFAGGAVHDALYIIGGFGPASAAIGVGGHLVG